MMAPNWRGMLNATNGTINFKTMLLTIYINHVSKSDKFYRAKNTT